MSTEYRLHVSRLTPLEGETIDVETARCVDDVSAKCRPIPFGGTSEVGTTTLFDYCSGFGIDWKGRQHQVTWSLSLAVFANLVFALVSSPCHDSVNGACPNPKLDTTFRNMCVCVVCV